MNENLGHIEVWNRCREILSHIIDSDSFSTWFDPVKPVSLVDNKLTLEVPSEFFRQYLDEKFVDEIRITMKRVLGEKYALMYRVTPVRNAESYTIPSSPSAVPENEPVKIINMGVNPMVAVGLRKVKIDPRINPAYGFENLVEGACNKLALTIGRNVADNPTKNPFNPLFIFGGSGLGKTHIAQAIGKAVLEKHPDLRVLYVNANEFKSQYVEATSVLNKLTDFMAFYMKIDVLIVDDIQDLRGQGSQNALFNVFNALHQNGKQLVFTSDRSPAELQNFEARLLSRFKWGMSVELGKPDYETRLKMLRKKAEREGISISGEVLELIARKVNTNFRELEGTLLSLIANATVSGQEITVELASQISEQIVGDEVHEIDIDKIQTAVCDYFNISKESLHSASRKRQIVQARQIAMYLSRNLVSNTSLATIGMEIGGKDHATVLHACSTVSDLMETDCTFKKYVDEIQSIVVSSIS